MACIDVCDSELWRGEGGDRLVVINHVMKESYVRKSTVPNADDDVRAGCRRADDMAQTDRHAVQPASRRCVRGCEVALRVGNNVPQYKLIYSEQLGKQD